MTHDEAMDLWKLFCRDHGSDPSPHDVGLLLISVERKEREACAKIADDHEPPYASMLAGDWGVIDSKDAIAAAIRAREGNHGLR